MICNPKQIAAKGFTAFYIKLQTEIGDAQRALI